MKKVFVLLLFIVTTQHYAQIISSTVSGGSWGSGTTWVGGVVPGAANDVIISGPITVDGNYTVKSLYVNTGCVVEHDGNYWRELNINNGFTNNGTLRHKSGAGYEFIIRCYGDVVNNSGAVLQSTRLVFAGDNNHTLTAGGALGCRIVIEGTGDITAGSSIRLNALGYFELDAGDVMNMGTYKLTIADRNTAPYSQSWSDGKILSYGELEIDGLFDCSLDGNFTLTGSQPMVVNGNFDIYGSITIAQGKSVQYDGSYWREVTVHGDLINNGIIKKVSNQSYEFYIKSKKNVQNNGKMENIKLEYIEQSEHIMSGNSFYGCEISITGEGDIRAGSNLGLDSLGYFRLDAGDIVNMGSYKLTINERVNTPYSESWNDGRIISDGELEISGKHDCSLDGSFTLTGQKPIVAAGNFDVFGNLTIGNGKYFQYDGSYWREILVHGDIINNGTIRKNHGQPYDFYIRTKKNAVNNGRIENIFLEFVEENDHFISGSSPFGCSIVPAGTGDIFAASDIRLDSLGYFNLDTGDSVVMGHYKLTIDERVNTHYTESWHDGRIVSDGPLDISGFFSCSLDGDFLLTGSKPLQASGNFTIYGDLRIDHGKIIEHDGRYWREISVIKDIVNYGNIRNLPGKGYELLLICNRNFHNFGEVFTENIYIRGGGTHVFSGNYINSNLTSDVENNILSGNLYCRTLNVTKTATLIGNSTLTTGHIYNWQNLQNNGRIIAKKQVDNNWFWGREFPHATVYISNAAGIDSITIEIFGNQVPQTYSGAVKRWYSISTQPYVAGSFNTLRLYYADNELGNNAEDKLELYQSGDNGKTWKQVSVASATRRYPDQNYVEYDNIPAEGDFLLSSNPDPVSVRTNICLYVIGRDRIRVGGAPNRYTFRYLNNSDVATGEILMRINGQQGVFIQSVEPSVPPGGSKIIIPVDSIAYDGKKDTIFLFVSPLAPREERSFDVIFTADNTSGMQKANILPLIGAALWWGAGAITAVYVTDVTMNISENIWQPVGCRTVGEALRDILYESWQQTNKDWFCFEKPARALAESAAEEMLEKGVGVAIPGKNIVEGAGRSMKGMQRYLDGDFNVVTDCDGKNKKPEGDITRQEYPVQKVTSWDPNEKSGPKGTGAQNFVSTAGRISYRIFFENKKEAQAPAWKILIVDTLAAEFNPSTVNFEIKSHEGENYNWQITKEYNSSSGRNDILKWYIEGIELPPNVNPPEGEGFVSFSVQANADLASGTSLRNSATITFDVNAPIRTNTWQNILDYSAPKTTLVPPSASVKSNRIVLHYSIDDGPSGSGGATTSIYGKLNEGGFELMGTSSGDSCAVDVLPGNYSFYALSKDNVGNVETVYQNIVTTAVTAVETEDNVPRDYALYQNYPNPFNPSTTIKYDIPFESNVRLEIFDVVGQRAALLVNSVQKAGSYSVVWNASSLASGMYIMKIEAKAEGGDHFYRNTKKIMLLK